MDEPLLQLQSSDGAIFVIPLRIARREIPMLAGKKEGREKRGEEGTKEREGKRKGETAYRTSLL